MIKKAADITGGIVVGLFVVALYIGRYLGLVGVLGLLARIIGWYKSWIWTWVIFVIIGFVSAAILEKLQANSDS